MFQSPLISKTCYSPMSSFIWCYQETEKGAWSYLGVDVFLTWQGWRWYDWAGKHVLAAISLLRFEPFAANIEEFYWLVIYGHLSNNLQGLESTYFWSDETSKHTPGFCVYIFTRNEIKPRLILSQEHSLSSFNHLKRHNATIVSDFTSFWKWDLPWTSLEK